MFCKYRLEYWNDAFQEFFHAHAWTNLSHDRRAAMLVLPDADFIPIVRTTCPTVSCWCFGLVHLRLMQAIDSASGNAHSFNNAMAEVYDPEYTKMRFHTDCALDLEDDSEICIFSCYEDECDHPRTLVTRDKESGKVEEMSMDHLSVIIFDVGANSRHVHKIVSNGCKARWLGLTLRTSKTFVTRQSVVFRHDGSKMTAATEHDRSMLFKLKGQENKLSSFKYPHIQFSLAEFKIEGLLEHKEA